MKGKVIWLLSALLIICVCAGGGYIVHLQTKMKEKEQKIVLLNKQKELAEKEEQEQATEEMTTEVTPNVQNSWLGKEKPTVLLLGSSVTQGVGASSRDLSWAGLLKSYFQQTNSDVQFINLGVPKYTTRDVINHSLPLIKNANPDVIILENCLINDYLQDFAYAESEMNIEEIMNALKRKAPNARIYIMPPNNIADKETHVNSEGISFENYVSKVGDYIVSMKWNYIDYWKTYELTYIDEGLKLKDTVSKDGIHPNDVGYRIWFDSIVSTFQ